MSRQSRPALTRLALAGLVAAILGVIGTVGVSFVLRSIVDPDAIFEPLRPQLVATFTVLGTIGATVAYSIVVALATRPARRFVQVAVVALILSFGPDLALLAGAQHVSGVTLERVLSLGRSWSG